MPGLCLTGGTIADAIHREVARQAVGRNVDWRRVELWWGDERYVAAGDADRNAGQARAAWLDHVDLDPEPRARDAGVRRGVRRRDRRGRGVRRLGPRPRLAAASTWSCSGRTGRPRRFAVPRRRPARRARRRRGRRSPTHRSRRRSGSAFTFAALNRTREAWFVASGDGKADAVARALGGADVARRPGHGRAPASSAPSGSSTTTRPHGSADRATSRAQKTMSPLLARLAQRSGSPRRGSSAASLSERRSFT